MYLRNNIRDKLKLYNSPETVRYASIQKGEAGTITLGSIVSCVIKYECDQLEIPLNQVQAI